MAEELVRSWPAAIPLLNRDLIMFQNSSAWRRMWVRIGVGIGAIVAAMLAIPGVAQADVTVQTGTAQGEIFSVVTLGVPDERRGVSTPQVRVSSAEIDPADETLDATSPAQSDNPPGWTLPLIVSGAALVLCLVSLVLAWHRGWRPSSAGEAASTPAREDVTV